MSKLKSRSKLLNAVRRILHDIGAYLETVPDPQKERGFGRIFKDIERD